MYQKVKHYVFMVVYLLLWSRFLVAIWDPAISQLPLEQGLGIYTHWRPAMDWLYYLSGFLTWPVETLYYTLVYPVVPQMAWFPGLYSATLLQQVQALAANQAQVTAVLQSPAVQQAMVGYIDFLVVLSVLLYRVLNPLVDYVYDFLKNLIWNLLIEFSFTKRKEATYQDALEKRAADLVKLNVKYKNLSKEASMLAESVITDELTKVYNKRFFLEKMAHEFEQARGKKQCLALVMVDIDHFKKLNDTYGHLMGDKVLQSVAQVVKHMTPRDGFCCRFGGEEFAVILPGKSVEDTVAVASKMHGSLPLLRFQEDADLRTSASFGVCVVDFSQPSAQQAIQTPDDLVKLADDELYRAKLNGRNRYEINTQYASPGSMPMDGEGSMGSGANV